MMFLQTLVQLHILLSAAPALAGWTVCLPASPVVPVRIVRAISSTSAQAASGAAGLRVATSPVSCHTLPCLAHPHAVRAAFPPAAAGAGTVSAAADPYAPRAP